MPCFEKYPKPCNLIYKKRYRNTSLFEQDTYRVEDSNGLIGSSELTRLVVHFENLNIVRILISGQQEVAGRIKIEIARRAAQGGLMSYQAQLAGLLIDAEDGDRIGSVAVGGIYILSIRRHVDIGNRSSTLIVRWQHVDGLYRPELAI